MAFSVSDVTIGQVIAIVAVLVVAKISWELFFSPLRAFSGPFPAKFTDAWRATLTAFGHVEKDQLSWHREYGSAVRIGPNCISISDPALIRTIYTTKDAWIKVLKD